MLERLLLDNSAPRTQLLGYESVKASTRFRGRTIRRCSCKMGSQHSQRDVLPLDSRPFHCQLRDKLRHRRININLRFEEEIVREHFRDGPDKILRVLVQTLCAASIGCGKAMVFPDGRTRVGLVEGDDANREGDVLDGETGVYVTAHGGIQCQCKAAYRGLEVGCGPDPHRSWNDRAFWSTSEFCRSQRQQEAQPHQELSWE